MCRRPSPIELLKSYKSLPPFAKGVQNLLHPGKCFKVFFVNLLVETPLGVKIFKKINPVISADHAIVQAYQFRFSPTIDERGIKMSILQLSPLSPCRTESKRRCGLGNGGSLRQPL